VNAQGKPHVAGLSRAAPILVALAIPLAVPATAMAVKPTKAERRQAAAECRVERGVTRADRLEFAAEYGRRRPFRRCVRIKARELAVERHRAWVEAMRTCRAERLADPVEFAEDYPGPRPLRQCVRMELL
jgi:hypothetical protein